MIVSMMTAGAAHDLLRGPEDSGNIVDGHTDAQRKLSWRTQSRLRPTVSATVGHDRTYQGHARVGKRF